MTGDDVFDSIVKSGLIWSPKLRMGYYPVDTEDEPYLSYEGSLKYMGRYRRMANSSMGYAITPKRSNFVRRHWDGPVTDVGIGCGAFIAYERSKGREVTGYDIGPAMVEWLHRHKYFKNPYEEEVDAVTLWDVLEHLPEPGLLVDRVREWVFVSIPIFESAEHVMRSRHYREDEHRWYFTDEGLKFWFSCHGFACRETSRFETDLGREDIGTYAFQRAVK